MLSEAIDGPGVEAKALVPYIAIVMVVYAMPSC